MIKRFFHMMGWCHGDMIFVREGNWMRLECMKCLYRSEGIVIK
jgi:hypothetical protein